MIPLEKLLACFRFFPFHFTATHKASLSFSPPKSELSLTN